ncbi:crystallin J1A-like isoform X1 [Ptychodera flava]|uniref:crystallin J1A-like isoform X1 n=1 Tax=Ptychodera flava TaxID=63121 RepID=UPI00396A39A4
MRCSLKSCTVTLICPFTIAYVLLYWQWQSPATEMDQKIKTRAIAAVVGAIVADAATQPLHWIYKPSDMEKALEGRENPEFRDVSACPFYTINKGSTSPYGDQAMIVLESLSSQNVDIDDYSARLYKFYGPGTELEQVRQQTQYPKTGSWTPGVIKTFLTNYEAKNTVTGEKNSSDMHTSTAAIAVVAKYAGQADMLDKVRKVIKVTAIHTEDIAIGLAAARLLEHYILNGEDPDAVNSLLHKLKGSNSIADSKVVSYLEKVKDALDKTHSQAGQEFGIACDYPGSFETSIHALLKFSNYLSAVRGTMVIGGDNCSRAAFIGACKAAQGGLESIPEDWKQKTRDYPKVLELAKQIVQM